MNDKFANSVIIVWLYKYMLLHHHILSDYGVVLDLHMLHYIIFVMEGYVKTSYYPLNKLD